MLPDDTIVRRYAELIAGHDQRVLLLGITRALAGLGQHLTAIDKSKIQIETMWPGDRDDRRAVLGDWREMEPPQRRYTAAIGDGCLTALDWPGEYRNVFDRTAQALAPGGIAVVRCFVAPEEREPLTAIVEDALTGHDTDWHAVRWRVAMAAADRHGSIASADLAATCRRIFPPLPELAKRTGWNLEAMEQLLDSFSRESLRYSFVTRSALLDTLPDTLIGARFVPSGEYPLSERCPFLVVERAG
jgi:hypothetical protein